MTSNNAIDSDTAASPLRARYGARHRGRWAARPSCRDELPLNSRDAFCREDDMDTDLDQMTREELVTEVKKLRQGIREHRDSSRHELCWHHPSLWGLLPERTDPLPFVPEWPEFIRGCVRYRQSLDEQAPNAPRTNKPYEK